MTLATLKESILDTLLGSADDEVLGKNEAMRRLLSKAAPAPPPKVTAPRKGTQLFVAQPHHIHQQKGDTPC